MCGPLLNDGFFTKSKSGNHEYIYIYVWATYQWIIYQVKTGNSQCMRKVLLNDGLFTKSKSGNHEYICGLFTKLKQVTKWCMRKVLNDGFFTKSKSGNHEYICVGHFLTMNPLSYFSFQPVLHNWCNKGCGMCYLVCRMVHIKEPLLLIRKSSLCDGSGFPFSLSERSLCLMPYNRK